MLKPEFDISQVLELIPPTLHDYTLVAGGYLVDPQLASDIDVWILGGAHTEDRARTLHEHIQVMSGGTEDTMPIPPRAAAEWAMWQPHPFQQDLAPEYNEGNLKSKGYYYIGSFRRIDWPLPAQVFVAPYELYSGLLLDFDLSVHQVAKYAKFGNHGPALKVDTTTARDRPIAITNWDTPSTTLTRYERLSSRYGKSLRENPDYDRLCALVTETSRAAA